MCPPDAKAHLHRYLNAGRRVVIWKLDGVNEYDVRRPVVPTGTNLLGLVKHLATVELGYFGVTFGRPFPDPPPWWVEGSEPNIDMWATAEETRDQLLELYRRVISHSDATIEANGLDAVGRVPWWPEAHQEVTLLQILVHTIAETDRHAGHADIIRELIDGAVGRGEADTNMADGDQAWWEAYRERVEQAAVKAAQLYG